MKRWLALGYGVAAYLFASFAVLYLVGFLSNKWVPNSIDSGEQVDGLIAVGIDLTLLALFGLQHSVMARRSFKAWWKKIVPQPMERSTYVFLSGATLAVLCWLWRPLPHVVWEISASAFRWTIQVVAVLGGILAVAATFAIDHFDLLGIRQVWYYWRGKNAARSAFSTPGPYRLVRHPIMLGLLIAFWAVPTMTVGHLLFLAVMTTYILVAIHLEERDLLLEFGTEYREYRRRVWMLVPLSFFKSGSTGAQSSSM